MLLGLTAIVSSAVSGGLATAEDKPQDDRPFWMYSNDTTYKVRTLPPRPAKPEPGWGPEGWGDIRARVEPRSNGPRDRQPQLALRHGFISHLGWLGRESTQDMEAAVHHGGPTYVVFPPTFVGGKGYYLPIHSHLFGAAEPKEASITFTWVPDSKTPEGIPPLDRDSLCIPQCYEQYPAGLMFTGVIVNRPNKPVEVPKMEVSVMSVTPPADDKGKREAEVRCEHYTSFLHQVGTAKVREGDILMVPGYFGFVVRHIVPRSEKTLALGWVDLDCHLIEANDLEAKAKKEGRAIVRFDMKEITAKK